MTTEKLQAALRRMAARGSIEVTLMEPIRIERRGRMVDSFRETKLAIATAMALIKDRMDFVGIGTGRKVRAILFQPADPSINWEACWRNSQASVIAFHGSDQRTEIA